MPQLPPIYAEGFSLNATWNCYYRCYESGGYSVWQEPSGLPQASNVVTFSYELPKRAKVKNVKVHSKWEGSLFGIRGKAVNGVDVGDDGFVTIDNFDDSKTSISVEFLLTAEKDDPRSYHKDDIENYEISSAVDKTITLGSHTSSVKVTEVYLLIEYEDDQGGYIYHAENGVLVPYNFYHAEGGVLVPYYMFGAPYDHEVVTQNLLTADGENLRTSDDKQFKVTGGE